MWAEQNYLNKLLQTTINYYKLLVSIAKSHVSNITRATLVKLSTVSRSLRPIFPPGGNDAADTAHIKGLI